MRFLYPSLFLFWAPLVLVPIVLYLFRPRPKTVRTSTLPFFKWLAREHQDAAWLRWLKHLLSLLISILVILGAAAALGRLVVAPETGSLKTVVILVDRSASMAAVDADGTTRLQAAVSWLQQRVAGLSAGVGVIVMAYDRRGEVLLSRSMDHRKVLRALASIEVRPTEGNPVTALRLAERLAELETPASIWHATDEGTAEERGEKREERGVTRDPPSSLLSPPSSPPPSSPPGVTLEPLCVALDRPINVGITAFQLRRTALERSQFDAFVQIHCSAPEQVEAELEIIVDGEPVEIRRLPLSPGGREKLLVPVKPSPDADRVLTLRVSLDGDVLPVDDVIHVRVPRLRPVRVLWISETPDPFTELALTSVGSGADLDVRQGPPAAWTSRASSPKEAVAEGEPDDWLPEVAIFDDWLPEKWPAEMPVIVINPPGALGPVQAARIERGGIPLEDVRAPPVGHPLLYGVATARVALMQTAVIEAGGPLESVWVGSQGPVMLAGEVRGQRVVVMGFSPQASERLPLMSSYPLLIGNAIYWAAAAEIESAGGMNRRTGELVELDGATLTWQDPTDFNAQAVSVAIAGSSVELDRIGLWETDTGQSGSASLLSTQETLVPSRATDAEGQRDETDTGSPFRGDLAPMLLWGILGLLVVESWLFHRYLAY